MITDREASCQMKTALFPQIILGLVHWCSRNASLDDLLGDKVSHEHSQTEYNFSATPANGAAEFWKCPRLQRK